MESEPLMVPDSGMAQPISQSGTFKRLRSYPASSEGMDAIKIISINKNQGCKCEIQR